MALIPPLYFWNPLGTFLKPYIRRTKVPQTVWILVILPHLTWKISKPMEKIPAEKFFKKFGFW